MKNRILLAAALTGALGFAGLTGFDSAATADDVLQKYIDASSTVTQASISATVNVDASIDIDTYGSMPITFKFDTMNISMTQDPLQMGMTAHAAGDAAGSTIDMDMEMYMVPEDDGSYSMYVGQKVNEGDASAEAESETEAGMEWVHTTMSADEASSMQEMVKNSSEFSDLYQSIPFTLASAPVDVNGTECYQLTADLSWDDMKTLLNNTISKLSESSSEAASSVESALSALDAYDTYLSGLVCHFEINVGTEDYLPKSMHVDLNGTDLSELNKALPDLLGLTDTGSESETSEPVTASITLNDVSMDYTYDYETPVTITVPEDALATPVSEDVGEALTEVNAAATDATAETTADTTAETAAETTAETTAETAAETTAETAASETTGQ